MNATTENMAAMTTDQLYAILSERTRKSQEIHVRRDEGYVILMNFPSSPDHDAMKDFIETMSRRRFTELDEKYNVRNVQDEIDSRKAPAEAIPYDDTPDPE